MKDQCLTYLQTIPDAKISKAIKDRLAIMVDNFNDGKISYMGAIEGVDSLLEDVFGGRNYKEAVQAETDSIIKLMNSAKKVDGFFREYKGHKNQDILKNDIKGLFGDMGQYLNRDAGFNPEAISKIHRDKMQTIISEIEKMDLHNRARELSTNDLYQLYNVVAGNPLAKEADPEIQKIGSVVKKYYDYYQEENVKASPNDEVHRKIVDEEFVDMGFVSEDQYLEILNSLDYSQTFKKYAAEGGPVIKVQKGQYEIDLTHKDYPNMLIDLDSKIKGMNKFQGPQESIMDKSNDVFSSKSADKSLSLIFSPQGRRKMYDLYGKKQFMMALYRDIPTAAGNLAKRKFFGHDPRKGILAIASYVQNHPDISSAPVVRDNILQEANIAYSYLSGDEHKAGHSVAANTLATMKSVTGLQVLGRASKLILALDPYMNNQFGQKLSGENFLSIPINTTVDYLRNTAKFFTINSKESREMLDGFYLSHIYSDNSVLAEKFLDIDWRTDKLKGLGQIWRNMHDGFYKLALMNRLDRLSTYNSIVTAVRSLNKTIDSGFKNTAQEKMYGHFGIDDLDIKALGGIRNQHSEFSPMKLNHLTDQELLNWDVSEYDIILKLYGNNPSYLKRLDKLTPKGIIELRRNYALTLAKKVHAVANHIQNRVTAKGSLVEAEIFQTTVSKDAPRRMYTEITTPFKRSVHSVHSTSRRLADLRLDEKNSALNHIRDGNVRKALKASGIVVGAALPAAFMMFGMEQLFRISTGQDLEELTPEILLSYVGRTGFMGIPGDMLFGIYNRNHNRSRAFAGPLFGQMERLFAIYDKIKANKNISDNDYKELMRLVPYNNLIIFDVFRYRL